MKIAVGRRYTLRNGARVHVVNRRQITTKIDGVSAPYVFFVGLIEGTRQKVSWDETGHYSPVAACSLDIVGA